MTADGPAVPHRRSWTIGPSVILALLWSGALFLVVRKTLKIEAGASWLPAHVDVAWLLLAAALYASSLAVRGFRWRVAIADSGISAGRFVRIAAIHTFWVNVLPARTGEFSLLHLLHRYGGVEYARSFGALYAVRLYDAATIGLYGVVALLLLKPAQLHLDVSERLWMTAFGTAALLCVAVLLASGPLLRALMAIVRGRGAWSARVDAMAERMASAVEECRSRRTLLPIFGLTVLSQGIIFLVYGMMLHAFGVSLTLGQTLFVAAIVEASAALPVHGLLSLGSQESVWVLGLGVNGVPALQAVGAGLCVHVGFLLMSTVAAGLSALGGTPSAAPREKPRDTSPTA